MPAGEVGERIEKERHQPIVGRHTDIVGVEVLELGEVETRRRFADAVDVEPRDHLVGGHDLVVAMRPG